MKTKSIKVCDAICVDITCDYNDPVDIKCGGPATVGYEFYVSPAENRSELRKFLEGILKKHHRKYMGTSFYIHKDFPVSKLWTRERMKKCIIENNVCL